MLKNPPVKIFFDGFPIIVSPYEYYRQHSRMYSDIPKILENHEKNKIFTFFKIVLRIISNIPACGKMIFRDEKYVLESHTHFFATPQQFQNVLVHRENPREVKKKSSKHKKSQALKIWKNHGKMIFLFFFKLFLGSFATWKTDFWITL